MSRRTLTVPRSKLDRFVKVLGEGATVSEACEAAGLVRSTAYDLRQRDEDFALAWADAIERGTETMEREARRRAVDGWEEPVFQGGRQVGAVRKFDSPLLMFLLKARRPEVYRERTEIKVEAQGTRHPDSLESQILREMTVGDREFEEAAVLLSKRYAEVYREAERRRDGVV